MISVYITNMKIERRVAKVNGAAEHTTVPENQIAMIIRQYKNQQHDQTK